jgi:hypothetical protein
MRQLALHVMTGSATLLILALLAVPAKQALERPDRAEAAPPGRRYVDLVGTTMIDFGGTKDYPVRSFAPRLRTLRRLYGKPIVLAETNTETRGAAGWPRDLRHLLRRMRWIRGVYWSQLPSRGKVQQRGTGVVDWDVQRVPEAAARLSAIIRDGVR